MYMYAAHAKYSKQEAHTLRDQHYWLVLLLTVALLENKETGPVLLIQAKLRPSLVK